MLSVWKTMFGYRRYQKYKAMLAVAPAVQGEQVAWSGWGCQYPGKMPRLYGERRIAELNCDWENGDQVLHFTAAPQPAEQQPECEKLRMQLQHMVNQTTPLEPVPGDPKWSRRIQLDTVIEERDSLRVKCEKLVELLEYFVDSHGDCSFLSVEEKEAVPEVQEAREYIAALAGTQEGSP